MIRHHPVKFYFYLLFLGVLVTALNLPSLVRAVSPTATWQLKQIWRQAEYTGHYAYQSTVVQTLHPTSRIENAGRPATVQRLTAIGEVDTTAGTFTMRIHQGEAYGQQVIDLKFENGRSYGRMAADTTWSEIEGYSEFFAPGGDLMGFLHAAHDIHLLAAGEGDDLLFDELLSGEPVGRLTRYVFALDGLRYAQYLREQMEQVLRRKGELTGAMHLALPRAYAKMIGSGELWVVENGLPVRLLIHLKLPPEEGAFSWKEVTLTTDFNDWQPATNHRLAWLWPQPLWSWAEPGVLDSLVTSRLLPMGRILLLLSLMLFLAGLVIQHRRSRRSYAIVVLSMVLALVAGPLLQVQAMDAAYGRFLDQQAQAGKQDELYDLQSRYAYDQQQELLTNQNALTSDILSPVMAPMAAPQANEVMIRHVQRQTVSVACDQTVDSDCDGLTDIVELTLGANPYSVDSDGDFISDYTEVNGFILNGKTWYLDPNNRDSNRDGLSDAAECPELIDVDALANLTTPAGAACRDSDGDGIPDIFDFDNDNDGVPDLADISPNSVDSLSISAQDHFDLSLNGYQTGKPLIVEFNLRPIDPRHLWYTGNVLDWPSHDRAGQIRRIRNSTFLDEGLYVNNPRAGNGDMLVQPMLEVKLPYSTDNPTRGLPISGTAPDQATTPIAQWLDQETLLAYGISVAQDPTDGMITAYVPLNQIVDPYAGDSPVAWSGRMFYEPTVANWGTDHQVRLMWTIIMLTDVCNVPADVNYDLWCSDDNNWTTRSDVVQTYYEDFHLTGLSVKEDHGMDFAVIAQKNAAQAPYENYLWHLSDALEKTFLAGQLVSAGGSRFDINAIVNNFGASDATIWGVPTNELALTAGHHTDQRGALNALTSENISTLLNTVYPNITAGGVLTPTLLIARESTYRMAMMGNRATVTVSGADGDLVVAVDLSRAVADTYASLQFTTYKHDGLGWISESPINYLDALASRLDSVIDAGKLATLFDVTQVSDTALSKLGVIGMAKDYYISLAYGINAIVAVGEVALGSTVIDANAVTLVAGEEPVLEVVADILDLIRALFTIQSYVWQNEDVVASSAYHALTERNAVAVAYGEIEAAYASDFGAHAIKTSFSATAAIVKEVMKMLTKTGGAGSAAAGTAGFWEQLQNAFDKLNLGQKAFNYFTSYKGVSTILAASSAGIKAIGAEEGWSTATTYGIATGIDVLSGGFRMAGALDVLWKQKVATISDELELTVGREAALVKEANIGYGVTYAFGIAVDWALFGYTIGTEHIGPHSMAFGPLLAHTIAETLLLIGELLLSILLPGIGELIVAFVSLIDTLVADVCKLAGVKSGSDVDEWVCGGITGAITESFVKLFYDQYVVVDLSDKHRLDLELQNPIVVALTGVDGFVTGNQLQLTARITNTIKQADTSGLGSTEVNDATLADLFVASTFSYTIESENHNHAASLDLREVIWNDAGHDQQKYAVFTITGRGDLATVGLNQISALYLNESWHIPGLECWGFGYQGCSRKDFKSYNPVNLGDSFIFDLFPPNIWRILHPLCHGRGQLPAELG